MYFQIFSYIFLTDICIWQFSDWYLTHFWLCSDCSLKLTVFWQNSDSYLTVFGTFGTYIEPEYRFSEGSSTGMLLLRIQVLWDIHTRTLQPVQFFAGQNPNKKYRNLRSLSTNQRPEVTSEVIWRLPWPRRPPKRPLEAICTYTTVIKVADLKQDVILETWGSLDAARVYEATQIGTFIALVDQSL